MSFLTRAVLATLLVSAPLVAADQPSNASGTLKVNGKTTNLKHAYGFHDAQDKSIRVMIASVPLTAKMLQEISSGESSGETESLRDLTKAGKASAIEIFVNDKNEVETVEVFDKAFGMPTPTSGRKFWYEPYRLSGAWVGGRSRTKQEESFFKITWEYDVTFLAPVGAQGFDIATAAAMTAQHKANDAREAARVLPAGGGEEGAMYLAYRKSLDARDGKALFDELTPSMKTAVATSMSTKGALTESALESWAFMQSMPPGKVEVVGGVRDETGTTLELRKTANGQKMFGTARLVKEKGAWKIAEDNWR